eukprot:CAMPEP_0201514400 /NCGR_PEP_ID=MMETSP0161_2-20130828/6253_1 /ASSEMBLY_ACC=CAM_ASM_000251 /TAXON_ID=180227 /ORGANISM="Neoparamoeba aestuarina, Strain SoJaBio B1-5/56/2" /LENGTH=75 /DNA_ID=CAMNT_0047910937 /DNA_START=314 /DNA_END=541 /DNA_ORIENTATION=+
MNPKLSNFSAMIKDELLLWSDESVAFRNKSLSTSSCQARQQPIKIVKLRSISSITYQARQRTIKLVNKLSNLSTT